MEKGSRSLSRETNVSSVPTFPLFFLFQRKTSVILQMLKTVMSLGIIHSGSGQTTDCCMMSCPKEKLVVTNRLIN